MKVLGFVVFSLITLVVAVGFADDMSNQYQQNTAPQQVNPQDTTSQQQNYDQQGQVVDPNGAQGNMNQQGNIDPNGAQGNGSQQPQAVPTNQQGQAGY